jgi:hypothetical protein
MPVNQTQVNSQIHQIKDDLLPEPAASCCSDSQTTSSLFRRLVSNRAGLRRPSQQYVRFRALLERAESGIALAKEHGSRLWRFQISIPGRRTSTEPDCHTEAKETTPQTKARNDKHLVNLSTWKWWKMTAWHYADVLRTKRAMHDDSSACALLAVTKRTTFNIHPMRRPAGINGTIQ